MEISVKIRNAYGRDIIDPVCDKAKLFAEIAGTKTLTAEAIYKIIALGVRLNIVAGEAPSFMKGA